MKKLMVLALVMVVVGVGVMLNVEAVPTVPPIPSISPTNPPVTEPPPDGGGPKTPAVEGLQKFEVISAEEIMEGYAGSSIDYNLKVIQKGYPNLTVNLTAEVPDKWKASFSKNDFVLKADEAVELQLSLSPPETISAEQHEIKIHATGKGEEESVEVEDSVTVTAMTYLIDVGLTNFQLAPANPQVGESVTISVTAVNFTQRAISNVVVELVVNSTLASRQTIDLDGGVSQPMTFGWRAESGTSSLVVRAQATGDNNHKNDSVSQKITLGETTSQADSLFNQGLSLFAQGKYAQAQSLFSNATIRYTEAGNGEGAMQASQYEELCSSYVYAQELMNQGDTASNAGSFETAAQYYTQARDKYGEIGDTQMQSAAQEKLDNALASTGFSIDMKYVGISVAAVAAIALVTLLISRRRGRPMRPVEPSTSRFRLEEPEEAPSPPPSISRPVSTSAREAAPARDMSPAELVQFHQKTEDALSRFSKSYIRSNLQQAMRVYLSLEGEKKQLPRGRDLELERIINANLKELEHRIFGTF
ncbi:MAG: tetratricopeptide repeat protein [Theionarchaea archaeon]|nr:tetratricopeptide repeat protein [Theionarchaea archaeon]MBU7020924.1 tetratricopeptide repeat protein [Theionarchaea archaeon]